MPKTGGAETPPIISLTVIGSPACTVARILSQNFLG